MRSAVADTACLRVLAVDGHAVVQCGFRLMLGSQAWVERCLGASTGPQACQLAARYQPHVAVIDLFVGAEAGTDISRQVIEVSPRTRVLFISAAGYIGSDSVHAAGAHGLIAKALPAVDIVRAVRMVAAGVTVFQATTNNDDGPQLSHREHEVLSLIAAGQTNRAIAASLHLSPHTVKSHTSSLYRKLAAKNRAQAVRRAQHLGLAM